jgi:hypothetical protein
MKKRSYRRQKSNRQLQEERMIRMRVFDPDRWGYMRLRYGIGRLTRVPAKRQRRIR